MSKGLLDMDRVTGDDELSKVIDEVLESVEPPKEQDSKECQMKRILIDIKDVQVDQKRQHNEDHKETYEILKGIKRELHATTNTKLGIVFVCGMLVGAILYQNMDIVMNLLEPIGKLIGFGNKVAGA
jgi:hypothetical protein